MPAESCPEKRPPVNYVFVDFENVPDVDLSFIGEKTVHLTLLLGPRQTRLEVDLVEKLMAHAASVQLVRLESGKKNALDFTLAYYLGRAVLADPNAYFHIISKDTGFDPLVEHLAKRHLDVQRHVDGTALISRLSAKGTAERAQADDAFPKDLLTRAVDHLRTHPKNQPKTKTKLASHLKSLLGKAAASKEIDQLIERLVKDGHVKIDGKGAVTYHLK